MNRRYISKTNDIYNFVIENCRQGFRLRVDGWPMATCDTVEECEQEAEIIAKDLMLQQLPDGL